MTIFLELSTLNVQIGQTIPFHQNNFAHHDHTSLLIHSLQEKSPFMYKGVKSYTIKQ